MFELWSQTLEYQYWGFDSWENGSVTTMTILILILTPIDAWGIWSQNQTVKQHASGEAVSVIWKAYNTVFFFTFCIYGFWLGSVAITVNTAVLAIVHVMLMWQLWKANHGFTIAEWVLLVIFSGVMIPMMLLFSNKDELYFVFAAVGIAALTLQPIKMMRLRSAGVVDLRMIIAYTVSTLPWVPYAYVLGQWAVLHMSLATLLLLGVMFVCWLVFPRRSLAAVH